MINHSLLIEKIARAIYYHEGGLEPDEWEEEFNSEKAHWVKEFAFQKGRVLEQHERDEYRFQACAVLDVLIRLGVINYTKGEAVVDLDDQS